MLQSERVTTNLSRRAFVRTLGAGGLGAIGISLISARGNEALLGDTPVREYAPAPSRPWAILAVSDPRFPLRLDSNENPTGPSPAAIEAIRGALGEAGRYADVPAGDLPGLLGRFHGIPAESFLVGCGSTEILRIAVNAYTSPRRGLVTASPSFEAPARYADAIDAPVISVPVTGELTLDLPAMAARSAGAGLVFVCNPNNPTATIRPAAAVKEFVATVLKGSSETTILVDEAYHEYVEDPGYATAIPLAMENARVIVSRTFSKVYGMAGLRIGYAIARPETIKDLRRHRLMDSVNLPGAVAAAASLDEPEHVGRQRKLNREARDLTRRFFEAKGFKVYPSEVNFIMVDVRRDSAAFRDECRKRGVAIGRPFPPLLSCARISIGTLDEMRHATGVFGEILSKSG